MASKHQLPPSASLSFLLLFIAITSSSSSHDQKIQRGFTLIPDSYVQFQTILTDPTSTFSFGFLRVNSTHLDLAILHLPSSFPLWRASPARPASWSSSTSLSFNGSLTLSDTATGLFWSTATTDGDELILLNSSNLQIRTNEEPSSKILWQSFDFPSDTIVNNQNFTAGAALMSTNQRFAMSLGPIYLALRMKYSGNTQPMYWKHTAMQAKATIVEGEGVIYARIDPTGFLGLHQKENTPPVDVISFDTFNSGIKREIRRLTLESDGNLRAYYWGESAWISDFVAISDTCDLPTICGPYGVCNLEGQQCGGCVDNHTAGCFLEESGNLCGLPDDGFWVLRRAGVDLANKELLGFQKVASFKECEGLCEGNCTCWGAVYNNVTGYCYRMDYPIQTLLEVNDGRKLGYFKVKNTGEGGGGRNQRRRKEAAVLLVIGALTLAGGCGFAGYQLWRNARRWRSSDDGEVGMPYKDLNSSSFRSIELSNSFRK